MKKVIFTLAAILVCFAANAQKLGIEAGYSRSFDYYKTAASDKWISDDKSNGGFLTFSAEFPGKGVVGFMTGLSISYDGSSEQLAGSKVSYSNMALSLPVDVIFNCKFSEQVGGFIYGGLTGGLGIISNVTVTATTPSSISVSETVNMYKEGFYNRCYLGFNVGLGIDIAKHYRIFGEYGQSLTNLINTKNVVNTDAVNAKFGCLSVGVGYIF